MQSLLENHDVNDKVLVLPAPTRSSAKWAARSLDFLAIIAILAGSIPLLITIGVLFSAGGNCIGNDHAVWIQAIDRVLSGNYNWLDFPRDTFLSSHCAILLVLIQVALACSGFWSVQLESLIGIGILAVGVLLQWDALSQDLNRFCRGLLLAALLAINFGTTQISSLVMGFYSLHHAALPNLGLSLGIWALLKFRHRTTFGAVVCGVGSLIATYSFGVFVPLWSALGFGALCQGYRRVRDLGVLVCACILSAAPYVYFLTGSNCKFTPQHFVVPVHFELIRFLNLLGRPLSNNMGIETGRIAAGEFAAYFGIAALMIMLTVYAVRRLSFKPIYPALAFILYALVFSYLITSYRATIAPWYAMQSKFFWIGLVAIACALANQSMISTRTKAERKLLALVGGSILAFWLACFLSTNRTYEDKAFYLYARSPASESCARHYQSAPTFGEGLLFLWDAGNQTSMRQLCSVLARHGLLCFGERQKWSLQGDYFLHTVSYNRDRSRPTPMWVIGRHEDNPRPWKNFLHLNLNVQSPQTVCWTIPIPASATNVRLHTACATAKKHTDATNNVTVTGLLTITSERGNSRITFIRQPKPESGFLPIEVPLDGFAGHDAKISFSATAGSAIFEYPTITCNQRIEHSSELALNTVKPENTDLSEFFVKSARRSLALQAVPLAVPEQTLHFQCSKCYLRDFSDLCWLAKRTKAEAPVVLGITFQCQNHKPFTAIVPLLEDNIEHGYTYPLKLVELPADTIVSAIDIQICDRGKPADVATVRAVKLIER